jgi:NADH-quinone oxidoreductase subunit N
MAQTLIDFSLLMPILIIGVYALFLILLSPFFRQSSRLFGITSLIAVVLAFIACMTLWGQQQETAAGMVFIDPFGIFFSFIILIVSFLTLLSSINFTEREGIAFGEYYALILLSTAGMMVMLQTRHLLMIFVGLELLSIPLYVLAGMTRGRIKSLESSLKYFLLGAFSTGFIVYGIALIYGATGSLALEKISMHSGSSAIFLIGMALVIIGFSFKIAAFPFHFWAPDVYQGSPTVVAGFMATGTKAAAFGVLLRILNTSFGEEASKWMAVLALISILTMFFGNLVALAQRNVKRILAYSSIAHAGYLLIAVVVTGAGREEMGGLEAGVSAIAYYLLAYTFMTIGAFTVASLVGRGAKDGEQGYDLESYSALGYKRPLLAAAMAVFLLSLTGIPPAAGFIGKFYIFKAAIEAKFYWLAILGLLNSVIAAYYYLRIIVYMYMQVPAVEYEINTPAFSTSLSLLIAVICTLLLGILPGQILTFIADLFRTLI